MTISQISLAKPVGIDGLKASALAKDSGGEDFSSTLTAMVRDTAGAVQNGEKMAMAGLKGQASVQEVTEAVMQAERSLQTAIALRDKAVSAYLDLTRMAI